MALCDVREDQPLVQGCTAGEGQTGVPTASLRVQDQGRKRVSGSSQGALRVGNCGEAATAFQEGEVDWEWALGGASVPGADRGSLKLRETLVLPLDPQAMGG